MERGTLADHYSTGRSHGCWMVEMRGLEPLASAMRTRRSPS